MGGEFIGVVKGMLYQVDKVCSFGFLQRGCFNGDLQRECRFACLEIDC